MAISSNFCYPQLHINGLRTPNIYMDRDGNIFFGCISVHVSEVHLVTDEEILSCAGQEAVDWWTNWKGVLIPLFTKMATEMDTYWGSTPQGTIAADVYQTRQEVGFLFQTHDPIHQVPTHALQKKPPMPKVIGAQGGQR